MLIPSYVQLSDIFFVVGFKFLKDRSLLGIGHADVVLNKTLL